MKTTKILTITALILATTMALFTAQATAITGNTTPSTEPYVGIVVLFSDAARTQPIGYCSGFLISPTIMLTAGHNLIDVEAVSVCFDKGPISYDIEGGQLVYYGAETIYNGTPELYPKYIPSFTGNREFATSDLGLIILDQPVEDITEYAVLPKAGYNNNLKAKTDLQIIGYGVQSISKNGGLDSSSIGAISQNSATAELIKARFMGSDKYLKLTANSAHGNGGITLGDSGGPVIYTNAKGQEIVVALHAYISGNNCGGTSYHTRLDVPEVLNWINGYLA